MEDFESPGRHAGVVERVRGVWSRHGLLGKHDRLMRLEKASADGVVQLNEEQVAAL